MFRRVLLGVTLILGLLAFGGPAGAGQYPVSCGFILDPPVVLPGGDVHILGSGFTPGSTVTFFIDGEVLGTTTADDDTDGNVDATFPLPPGFDTDGEFVITAECPNGEVASNVLIVGTGVPSTATVALPVTGSNGTFDLIRVGAALIAAGGIVLLVVRKRAHAEA